MFGLIAIAAGVVLILLLALSFRSLHYIGETEAGLVFKRFGKKLSNGSLIAMKGEAGYQPDLLMPGWRLKMWPLYKVEKHEWVQIPPDAIGVVIAQVGAEPETGAKSGVYKKEFGDFSNLAAFLSNGGQRGLQRPVLPPNTTVLLHPVAFIVVTRGSHFGRVLTPGTYDTIQQLEKWSALAPVNIPANQVGIVKILDGPERESGTIASRLDGFADIQRLEEAGGSTPADIIQRLFATKNGLHNNYQDFQEFLAQGGRMGLQHDPLLSGRYLLNPLLVEVEVVPMLVVEQGQVAVIKAYVGLPTVDTSGEDYKYGSIVAPGHMGIWYEPLRTGMYPINPKIYKPELVPTSILTLNWASETSEAHDLDKALSSIEAKSLDTFDFKLDLQVQIHVPDTQAPMVVGMMRTMQNLVNEVLQPAAGNHFFNALQKIKAIDFIQKREQIQQEAERFVRDYLQTYHIEVRGVYIQNVVFPDEVTKVQQQREIADQQKAMFAAQQEAQASRVTLERQRGEADMQADLVKAQVTVDIERSNAEAVKARAAGNAGEITTVAKAEAEKIEVTTAAEAKGIKAKGQAQAEVYDLQAKAIGPERAAAVAVAHELAEGGVNITRRPSSAAPTSGCWAAR